MAIAIPNSVTDTDTLHKRGLGQLANAAMAPKDEAAITADLRLLCSLVLRRLIIGMHVQPSLSGDLLEQMIAF
jgi:hypothetical protein